MESSTHSPPTADKHMSTHHPPHSPHHTHHTLTTHRHMSTPSEPQPMDPCRSPSNTHSSLVQSCVLQGKPWALHSPSNLLHTQLHTHTTTHSSLISIQSSQRAVYGSNSKSKSKGTQSAKARVGVPAASPRSHTVLVWKCV